MGYRSDVCIKCDEKAYNYIKSKLDKFEEDTGDALYPEEDTYNDLHILLWYDVKWYDGFPEIDLVNNTLNELDMNPELGKYYYCRIGEDVTDIEERCNNDYEFAVYVNRTFDYTAY